MSGWTHLIRLGELTRGPVEVHLAPDESVRAMLAQELLLDSLPTLVADLRVRPWLDGAEITGRFTATVGQICGVSLDVFEQELTGEIALQMVPLGSPNAYGESEEGGDLALDLDAPDPPDVLEGDEIDLAHILVEHLALEIDPFPRKPGAEFTYTPNTVEESPFAVLRTLKKDGE
ncbi:DUF177 domain-containing protein [Phenylobacterium sp.]|uniref:YceD family protein n=1 Tax=Phenylobacterium sp. TaxID=1871053 RepID=UPI00286AD8D0|nr:DUF177 domain-containing protein [Phenylobacterium sp.]